MDGFLPPGLVEVYAGTMATHVEEPGPCLGLLVVPWLDRGIQFNNCAYRLPGPPFVSWTIRYHLGTFGLAWTHAEDEWPRVHRKRR